MTVRLIALLLLATLVALAPPAPAGAQSVGDVFRKVSPSVVVIRSRGRDVSASGQVRFGEIGSGRADLGRRQGDDRGPRRPRDGRDHVEFIGGEAVPARVVASEPAADLSLLQLDRVPANVRVSRLADSRSVRVGDQVLVVGAPYGLAYSLSVGYISARWPPNSVYPAFPLAEFFQTDATINTGNSGGPLFNMAGDVIGIVSHNISKGGGSEGLGFVVTINTAKDLLLARRSIWSGLEGHTLSGDLAAIFNLPQPEGFLVKTVAKGSPAEEAGIRGGNRTAVIDGQTLVVGGDVLLAVEGIPAGNLADYKRMRDHLQKLPAGATITVTVLRAGRVLNLVGKAP